ncbi:hypothetical protein QBC38DRAFT_200785 [Podospora fimiseda]|uniref:Uncharacterized protein n=1 Tax=Podospora fimiseda TaxID=252190 RepID=A0AAN7BXV5_9PEZI|nr:hypothetical protein QBC38DRAFT_200785 [Podospora fimiseda]
MLRLFRFRKPTTFPIPLRSKPMSSTLPGGQVVRVERVRIKQRRGRFRFLGFIIKSFIVIQVLDKVVLAPFYKFWDEHAEELEEERRKQMAKNNGEEEVLMFIPFPLTLEKFDARPYNGRDPEWQEFVRISRDKEFLVKVREDTANLVFRAVQKNPVLGFRFGKDMKIRRYWMDLDFPYKAPPEYQRTGILITDEAISLAAEEVDSATAKLWERVFWPQPVALSAWAVGKAFVSQQLAQAGRYLGLDIDASSHPPPTAGAPSPLPTSHNPDVQKVLERMRQHTTKRPEEVRDPSAMSAAGNAPTNGAPAPAGKPSALPQRQSAGSPSRGTPADALLGQSPGPGGLWDEFRKKYAQVWKPIRPDPPRGCFAVSGLVEIETQRAYLVIDVLAWYNPKTKEHDRPSMWMSLRRMQFKQQGPLSR